MLKRTHNDISNGNDIGDERQPDKRPRLSTAGIDSTDFWFTDGDIVLAVERLLFRVHKRVLSQSPIWRDMLEIPQSPDGDTYDGLPLVHLYGDTANDWLTLFAWLYNPEYVMFIHPLVAFLIISGALRLATKYEIRELRAWTASHLSQLCPPLDLLPLHISQMGFLSHEAVIAIARETDLPHLLPTAFYLLATNKGADEIPSGNENQIISFADSQRLINGREGLQRLIDEFQAGCPQTLVWNDHTVCRGTLGREWHHCLPTDIPSARFCILSALHGMINEQIPTICDYHNKMHRYSVRRRMARLIKAIPTLFSLSSGS
ncbi:hypothetical protein BU17DRAFT_57205 [Hysterangium stoloniferum]|nr:hypothetical protein BU17DRAFT_57205 [Hysterangium stoloniferum]